MTSTGKNGLNIGTNASPKWDRTRCPEEKHQNFGNEVKIVNKVQFGNKFANWCNV